MKRSTATRTLLLGVSFVCLSHLDAAAQTKSTTEDPAKSSSKSPAKSAAKSSAQPCSYLVEREGSQIGFVVKKDVAPIVVQYCL